MKPNKGFITVFMMVLISISLSTFSRAAFDTFSDVPNDSPFHESIFYLAERGIVRGEGNGRYVPDAPVTVRQWAMMLCRALGNDNPLNYDDDCIRQGYSDGWLEMTAITAPDSDLCRYAIYKSGFAAFGVDLYSLQLYPNEGKLSQQSEVLRAAADFGLCEDTCDGTEIITRGEAAELLYALLTKTFAVVPPPMLDNIPLDNKAGVALNNYLLEIQKIPESMMQSFAEKDWRYVIDFDYLAKLSKKYDLGCTGATIYEGRKIIVSSAKSTIHEFGHFLDGMMGFPSRTKGFYQRESASAASLLRTYAQTATQEHFSNSSMQNTSSIRQTAFRGAEARKSSVPSGMRREPAYVTSANRDSPSSAQTPAAGHDTSGNKTTSTVREQSNVTASIRTANSAQHSLSGNASQHEPAGRSPAPMSTRMTQANMQGVRSKVNDRSAQRPEQTENAAAQSIDHAVPAVAQRPSPGSAGISSSPAVSGQHSSQPFGMGTRYTQRPSARGVSEQKPKAIRPGHAGTSPTQPAPSSTVESARSSSGRAAHPASSTQGPIAGSRPDRNIPQGSNVPPNQTRKTNNNPARQEARPIGIRNEPSAKGMFSAQRPDPAGNRADVSQGTLTRPTTGNRAVASKNVLMPSTLIKGSVKNSKEISSSSRKQRREKHERK